MAAATEAPCRASPKLKLNELFVQWFNLPETQHVISLVLDDAVRAQDDPMAGTSAAAPPGGSEAHRPWHLSIAADGRSPPSSPTAKGLSSLSLSSSPRTPPRSPEVRSPRLEALARAAGSTARGAAGEADALAAALQAAISPGALASASSQRALAAASAADAADADDGASPPAGNPALSSPRSRPSRASSRLHTALSPQKRSRSLVRHEDDATGDDHGRAHGSAGAPAADGGGKKWKETVPPFYVPLGRQPADAREGERMHVRAELEHAAAGAAVLAHDAALAVCVGPLQLPAAAARVLLARLAQEAAEAADGGAMVDDPPAVPLAPLAAFADELAVGFPLGARVFHALAGGSGGCLRAPQLRALVRAVVEHHPGLAFLAATPEFQERYVETVVLRILYTISRCGAPVISRAALQRSALPAALASLDREADINASAAFFSYEHFYVIYCKFWELDDDHDMRLSQEDLCRYADYSLSSRIVQRVYATATQKAGGQHGLLHAEAPAEAPDQAAAVGAPAAADGEGGARMTYPHFVCASAARAGRARRAPARSAQRPARLTAPSGHAEPAPAPPGFVLSEEDKSSRVSVEYWFERCDLDQDGYISGFEARSSTPPRSTGRAAALNPPRARRPLRSRARCRPRCAPCSLLFPD